VHRNDPVGGILLTPAGRGHAAFRVRDGRPAHTQDQDTSVPM